MGCRNGANCRATGSTVSNHFSQPGMPVNDYDALRDYLKKQTLPEFVLSFERIEEIIMGKR